METGSRQDVGSTLSREEDRSLLLTVGVTAAIVALPALLAVAAALLSF